MSLGGRVNKVLRTAAGVEIRRLPTGAQVADAAVAKEARRAHREAERAALREGQKARKAAGAAKAKAAGQKLPADYDSEVADLIRTVKPYTMTSHEKLHALIMATRYIARCGIEGDVVECGVWRGGSMHAIARTLHSRGDTARNLYLFDTFEGMPPPSDRDARVSDGASADSLLAKAAPDSKIVAAATLEDVQAGMAEVPYPAERIHYVKGKVEETVPGQAPERIALLRLDTDWYSSTKHELETLYPRLVSGGVLLIDDYGWWAGSREATDEWLAASGERLLLVRMGTGRIALKP